MKSKLLYERALITCVIMLIVCVILKLFGVPWFNLDTSIPIVDDINRVIANNILLGALCNLFFKSINAILMSMILIRDFKEVIKHILPIIVVCFSSMFVIEYTDTIVGFVYEIFSLILLFKIIFKQSFKDITLCLLLNILYQMISVFIRSVGFIPHQYGFVNYFLLNFDYYLMLVITYLYLKERRKQKMYLWGGDGCFFFFPSKSAMEKAYAKFKSMFK